jgi:hypothetical protein
MRVIYIAGAAHSGSTLLDMMLNAHPEIVSVGEVLKLNNVKYWKSGEGKATRCSCGAIGLLRCPFWSRVNSEIERRHGKSLADLNVDDYRTCEQRPEPNTVLFEAIAAASGKNFIVDSSKIPRRLEYLTRCDALNVHALHLIRSPKGQIAWVVHRFGIVQSIFRYEVVNAQTWATLKSVRHGVVRYEDLVLRPEQTLQRVLAPIGLKFHPLQLAWAEQPKHSFAGNHARFQTKSELLLDENWKHRLSRLQRLLVDVGTILSRSRVP